MCSYMKRTSALLVVMALSACGGGSGDSSHQVSTANSSQAQTSLSVSSSSASTAPTSSSSNSSTSSAPVALENVAVTVGPEGKFISLKQVELDIPANALSAPTTFSLQEQVPNVGELVRVDITPSALAFAVPAEVRFNATNLSAKTALFWQVGSEFWLLPTTVTATGISAKIDNIGYTKTTSAQASLFSRLFKTSAFAAAATPDDELSSANALVALEIDCDTQIDQLSTKIDGARRSGDSSRAIAIKSELVALKSSCSASIHLKTLEVKSCDALAIAIANAQVFSATNFADFFEIETSLMAAQSFVQATQASCPSINMEVINPLIEEKFTDFLTVLQSKLLSGELIEKAGRRELQTLMSYKAVCEELDLTSACDVLTNRIYPELLDGMRLAALKKCQDNQSRLPLAQFYLIGSQDGSETKFLGYGNFSLAAVEADLHYCTDPSLGLQVFNGAKDSSIELKDRAQTLKPLEALGKYRTKAAVNVPRDGSLKVSGELPGLLCPSGDISQADLVVRIGAHEITRQPLTGSVYALSSQPLKLVVLDALGKTNLDPELTTAFTLDIYREGGKCTDDVKEILMDSFKLFEIEVSVDKTKPTGDRISAAAGITCALTTAGGVKCWGFNGDGRLGDGATTNRLIPVDVAGLSSGVIAVSAGGDHTCALTSVGGLKCWGAGANGQLGNGSAIMIPTPVDVTGLGSGVIAVSTGSNHNCALTSVGGVKCWGYNGNGRLGDGTTTGGLTPVSVTGLGSGVIAIRAGASHTCALTSAGGVKCWGSNVLGELGDGSTTERLTPVEVSGLGSGVIAISTHDSHTCALTITGSVKCWGFNRNGRLGDGTTTNRPVPVDVTGLGSGVIAVSAAGGQTCALTSAGGVKCWGYNGNGQLGDGSTNDRLIPVDVTGLGSGVIAVSVGGDHTCALTSIGGVKCWGNGSYGQLGDGSNSSHSLTPVDVIGFP